MGNLFVRHGNENFSVLRRWSMQRMPVPMPLQTSDCSVLSKEVRLKSHLLDCTTIKFKMEGVTLCTAERQFDVTQSHCTRSPRTVLQ
eukprot:575075-Amphidinium_carterae.1